MKDLFYGAAIGTMCVACYLMGTTIHYLSTLIN